MVCSCPLKRTNRRRTCGISVDHESETVSCSDHVLRWRCCNPGLAVPWRRGQDQITRDITTKLQEVEQDILQKISALPEGAQAAGKIRRRVRPVSPRGPTLSSQLSAG